MEILSGTVEKVIYRQDNGYAVLALRVPERLLPATVVGSLASVAVGEELQVQGHWTSHSRFGDQFKVVEFRAAPPETADGIVRYLSSGAVSGVGPGLARRLVDAFGAELFDIASNDPLLLMQVPGIGKKRSKIIAAALAENRAAREAMVFLQGLGLGPMTATRVYEAWGDQTLPRVKADPYRLVQDVDGIGFSTADSMAKALGIQHESSSRLRAGLIHLLREGRNAGHTVSDREDLLARAAAFLEADVLAVEGAADELVHDRAAALRDAEPGPLLGLPPLVFAEEVIADELSRIGQTPKVAVDPAQVEQAQSFELTEDQLDAVQQAAAGPIAVITGGPGTGKTTVIRTLVGLLARSKQDVVLCAPTGRAAKRLSEASGRDASTVHRLLGFRAGGFAHNAKSPLPPGTVILDEASMLDVLLMRRLVEAIPSGQGRLVLVGDADQLPSVGPGNVLADLVRAQIVPVVRLGTVFRQAETSRIVHNAHRIRRGELPEPSSPGATGGGDFHIVHVDDPERARELVVEICCERIPKAYGFDPVADVQLLSPMHRGVVGTVALNAALQQRLNPSGPSVARGALILRMGDKVMQIRNDHDRDVFNGDVGRIIHVDPESRALRVLINGSEVDYSAEQSGQLAHAYCVSIHKSQGSEYPAVVIPLLTQHYMLLQRNLLYTAVTRAKQLVVLVGSSRAIKMAIDRVDPSRRITRLASLMAGSSVL